VTDIVLILYKLYKRIDRKMTALLCSRCLSDRFRRIRTFFYAGVYRYCSTPPSSPT